MSKEDFRLLRDLIYTYCGIFFHDDVRYIFERRIGARMRELGLATHQDYYRHLRYHPKRRTELEEIVELLTTNETYFFREEYQLRAFSEEILPELIERNASRRRLRVWSAGCSTGEEVYTVGILLRENRKLDGWNLEVFGNDISRKVLQVARKGIYGKNAFRVMEPYYLKHYFHPVGNSYAVDESLRSLVSFGYLNLLDGEMLQLVGEVDVVFCRNVLIYFDASARIRVLATFHDKLRRGGYLLLGHSESLVNVSTDFELVHLVNDMVYRKACTDLELGRSA
ncbi:MAG: protein-glutamate O-methyltransferase CheR [Deltaproteobacteria bacterium]|nr:protein-glutamate O-methyltransferase CheR [Deltaproteobacteria bacterium]